MKKSALVLLTILFFAAGLKAQCFYKPSRLPGALQSSPKLTFQFDSWNSFISNRDVKIFGGKLGLEFDEFFRVGFGVYGLSSPFYRNIIVSNENGTGIDTVNARLKFSYMTVFAEYVFFTSKRWQFSVPVDLGVGESAFSGFERSTSGTFVLADASIKGSYKIFPFFGLGGGVGYRTMLMGNQDVREKFNSPSYNFGLKLWIGWFYKKLFPDDKGNEGEFPDSARL